MSRDKTTAPKPAGRGPGDGETPAEDSEIKVEDKRHWQQDGADAGDDDEPVEPAQPTVVEGYKLRAEQAERKLQEYIEAFKSHQAEQDQVRARLARDVDRRVELQFGELLTQLVATVDDLDLSLSHVREVAEARPLAKGVAMARDRFLKALERSGVERISPQGRPFDPNEAEAMRVDPIDSPEQNDMVTETLRPGYRLGKRVIRPAQVAVGRHTPPKS